MLKNGRFLKQFPEALGNQNDNIALRPPENLALKRGQFAGQINQHYHSQRTSERYATRRHEDPEATTLAKVQQQAAEISRPLH